MRYFIDTEFIEDGKTIDLISIGIAAEDGRTYYAISTEFNRRNLTPWLKENVIPKLAERYVKFEDSPRIHMSSLAWKSRKRIAKDILEFVGDSPEF